MFYLTINLLILMFSTLFMFMKHPLAMGLILLMQTLMICLSTGLITKSFWFSYVLFLIFIGGMLVLFIYVTSLASNEMFNFSSKILYVMSFIFMLLSFLFFIMDKPMLMNYFVNYEIEEINSMKSYLLENMLILNKLYNFPMNIITFILMIYLFLTLIAIVKITNIFEGPLRPNF